MIDIKTFVWNVEFSYTKEGSSWTNRSAVVMADSIERVVRIITAEFPDATVHAVNRASGQNRILLVDPLIISIMQSTIQDRENND